MHPLVDEMIEEIVGTACAYDDDDVDVRVQESRNRVQIQISVTDKPVMDIILNLTRIS
ncbi:hypothetical protein Q4R38_03530 [Morganella morganii]|uniref:hypothetical protein n=1 Tax=Morganella morganii TaxID=582 RepID=UPI001454C8CE|nr:hypothetical protein [Morganella morganii]EKU4000662.1 hypothetical protein [Morganella morganii]MBT0333751.1 hypothetical protein [Morganella morganii subsp. morganii]MBT0406624.1 hypothetical protein [Morganella morganii subsp. morganii]MBT0423351.1 hypothetical protein [Morganella morganii subsp. morganii]MBT0470511.1 hypothetical protein [Morganella morganii subsp. morganii]